MRALARHIVTCLVCTDVLVHAIRCMQTDGEMDDVWCTSMRRLVRREKRLRKEWQKGGNSARLTLSRLDTVAAQPRTARATAIFGSCDSHADGPTGSDGSGDDRGGSRSATAAATGPGPAARVSGGTRSSILGGFVYGSSPGGLCGGGKRRR